MYTVDYTVKELRTALVSRQQPFAHVDRRDQKETFDQRRFANLCKTKKRRSIPGSHEFIIMNVSGSDCDWLEVLKVLTMRGFSRDISSNWDRQESYLHVPLPLQTPTADAALWIQKATCFLKLDKQEKRPVCWIGDATDVDAEHFALEYEQTDRSCMRNSSIQ